jgi:GTP:adenosylcobinamide-phosphate guanylyltransferase/thiamine kinase-like enzyme
MKIIIQAGGRGSRMNNLTTLKPKCLVPIFGKPILFHWLDLYPEQEFIIICDYKKEVLKKYTNKFRPTAKITFIETDKKGTCSGVKAALEYIQPNSPFVFTWSDLVPSNKQKLVIDGINIGLTSIDCSFPCRWKYENTLKEENNIINGVAGIFTIQDKNLIQDIPQDGPFTDYLVNTNKQVNKFYINDIIDIGTEEQFRKNHTNNRFFNEVIIQENTVTKRAKIKEYEKLIKDELNWYDYVADLGFDRIPKIYSREPFIMSKIDGVNPFLREPSESFLKDVLETLKSLHSLQTTNADISEMTLVYKDKTFERINSVQELIPFIKDKTININSKTYKNPFHEDHKQEFLNKILNVCNVDTFTLIHGDPTFSNMISSNNKAYLIDPRGYFGKNKLVGDPRYDYAKLYYSFYGNYDNINSKNYFIDIKDDCVIFNIKDHGWSELEDVFFNNVPYTKEEIKLIHVLIWFSLCGYVIEDYSSILLAFYNGVKLYNELS